MTAGLDSLPLTIGALIGGSMTAIGLSAIVGFQTFLYFQIFPMDTAPYKCLVAWIWLTDIAHTITVCTTIWQYAVHIMLTVIATLNANLFYTWRIHKMSKYNWWITGPICLLCLTRTSVGFYVASSMLLTKTKTWENIHTHLKAAEVAGRTASATTDVVISLARYYYLRDLKQGYMQTREMVDAVVIFTINDGLLSCATVITMIACLLSMPNNLIWIAIFFTLAKLFSNSILTTLNLRNWYRHRHMPMGIPLARHPAARNTVQSNHPTDKSVQSDNMHEDNHMSAPMQVYVDQQVEYNVPVGKYNEAANSDTHSRP
ncbi:hypothetical protein B0H14DRAFT_3505315 [Mycena olivaceomarginata]|nr:hypothetical protein B0H14DRAFT_3505315 [Mycena olivaceomarginata]